MATYYVSTSGSDTTGDGSAGNPWATLHKAITTVTDNVAHTIKVAPGTYAEDSGSGYLSIAENRTELGTIESTTGDPDDVIVTGASSATYNVVFPAGTPTKFHFKNITFKSRVNTNEYVVVINANANAADLTFEGCVFEQLIGGDNDSKRAFYVSTNDTKACQNITFTGCTFKQTGTKGASESVTTLSFARTAAGATIDAITFTGNNVYSQGSGPIFQGVTNLDCSDNVIVAENNVALTLGKDAGTDAQDTTGTCTGNKIKANTSHGLLLGNGCNGVVASGNRIVGGDHGAVIKNSVDVVFTGNFVTGGSGCYDAIYIKASSGTIVTCNVAICSKSGGCTLRVGEDTTHSTLYAGAVVRGNTFIARNGADIYYWGPDAEETGETSICDQNTLILQGSGKYGDVKDTADCATLAAVRTAWSDYDVTTNDSQSADGDVAFYSALGAAAGAGRLSVSI